MQWKLYETQFVHQVSQYCSGQSYRVCMPTRTITFSGTRFAAFIRELNREDLTRISSYPVAELQRKLTMTWFDITSTRTCFCWRWATRGSIRTANAIRTIRVRRVILAIRVILPPDMTSLSSNYLHRLHIYHTHPSPIPHMHMCIFTTTVTREPERTRNV